MRVVSGSTSGEISTDTVFEFEQTEDVFSARYVGGQIIDGYLIGRLQHGYQGTFRYVQADSSGNLDSGVSSVTLIRLPDGRLRMVENFQWLTRDASGTNVLEEIEQQ